MYYIYHNIIMLNVLKNYYNYKIKIYNYICIIIYNLRKIYINLIGRKMFKKLLNV